jgi:hypothetical protein
MGKTVLENNEKEASYVPPILDIMINEWQNGAEIGESCRVAELEKYFSWKRGFINCWTGFGNNGKTQMFFFLALLQAVYDKKKVCIWSPEMMSSHRTWEEVGGKKKAKVRVSANDIYNELIWMMTGSTPYQHISDRYKVPKIGMPEYMKAKEFIEEHFFVLYPKDRTHTGIINSFRQYYEMEGIDIFLADPFKAFKQSNDERTDLMLNEYFIEAKEFSIETHSSFNYIAHPKNLSDVREKGKNGQKGAFKVVDQFMISGGAAWDNNMDGIYSIYRPERHLDLSDPKVHFWNLKQRKQELVGSTGVCEGIVFDPVKRKYYFNNVCPMDGSVREGYMKNEDQSRRVVVDLFSRAINKEFNPNDKPF